MTGAPADADSLARSAIREQLETSLIVEAGAGTGKTHSLVDRIEALIVSGKANVDEIVAITFTRAAASELRERVRTRLEGRARDARTSTGGRERFERALAGLDTAAIQTIDSFALSLVRERNLEARVPPLIDPMDEIEAGLAFEERWRAWLDERLEVGDLDDALALAVRLGFDAPLANLREVARAFHQDYRLLEGVRFDPGGPVARSAAKAVVRSEKDIAELLGHVDERKAPELANSVVYLVGLIRRIKELGVESDESLHLLAEPPKFQTHRGQQDAWGRLKSGVPAVRRAKEILGGLQKEIDSELGQARAAALAPLLSAVSRFVLDYAEERRRQGRPEFQDLLVWATDLVDVDSVRAEFQARFRYILIDEFQDTNPLQTELALKLASDPAGKVRPGSLFIVGDPKQSIYRFRHADLSALRRVRSQVAGDPIYLTRTRRTHDGLVAWINELFGGWMGREERPGQPAFVDLVAARRRVEVTGPAQGVYFLGDAIEGSVGVARQAEVRRIVDVALSVRAGEWRVLKAREKLDSEATRPSRAGDLCILVPTRASLVELERGLEDAGVPYVLEGQSLIFNTQEVRDLINCLNAIDDPSNEVAIVAALRSPAFGCSDVDLHAWVSGGRRFDYLAAHSADAPVGTGLLALRGYHGERQVLAVPHLVEKFVRERRLREAALDSNRPRERWRLLQAVIEQARSLARAGRPSLRELVEWAIERRTRAEGITDGAASDVGGDAVRIMTVHYAKGLEFPIVLLTALNAGGPARGQRVIFEKGLDGAPLGVAVRAQTDFEFGEFDAAQKSERLADAEEDIRVMYVAATRAQDYLLVSLYRSARGKTSAAAGIARRMGDSPLWSELRLGDGSAQPNLFHMDARQGPPVTEAGREEWRRVRDGRIAAASRRATVTATSLSVQADLEDTEFAPSAVAEVSFRRRGGSSIGRAVHGVLQRIDFHDLASAGPLARELAAAEGIPGKATEIEALAAAVAREQIVQRGVSTGRLWREVYVSGMVGEQGRSAVVEGFIDLVYELEDGTLCIVDYKTDSLSDSQSLEEATAPHLLQIGAYAAAIARATGKAVGEAWILFARRAAEDKEAQYRVPGLDELANKATRAAVEIAGSAAS